uniref:TRAF-type domain-containing protein n=1 Tax=Globodera rostochiensis TaxID=31243 RepID=A0A914HT77_GLORO
MTARSTVVPQQHKHCVSCFKSRCSSAECAMCNCPDCGVRMHICKLEDHREGGVCLRALSACPNALYGCTARMRRHALNEHIQHCPASLLLCPFTRNRHFVSTRAKTMLKRIARGYSTQQKTTPSSSVVVHDVHHGHACPPDIALAHVDQLTLEQSFRLSRSKRLSLAVALRRRELEQLLENNNNIDGKHFKIHGDGVVEEEEDSSEEEAKITASQYRAMREPFLGCRLCALDPGSQHLHQLGSLRPAIRNDVQQQHQTEKGNVHQTTDTHQSSADYTLKFLPTLNRQNALFISHEMSLNVAGVNLNEQFFRTNFPIFACDEFVRRDQFNEHCAAHLAYEDDGLAFFARCPNAQYGCTFHLDHQLLTVDGGLIRFNPFIGMAVHEHMPLSRCRPLPSSGTTTKFAEQCDHFFELLGPFLDDASLRSLSTTCRRLRHLLPTLLRNRLSVELRWEKKKHSRVNDSAGRVTAVANYEICGKRHFFGTTQCGNVGAAGMPRLQMQPRGALIDHLQHCACAEKQSMDNEEWVNMHKVVMGRIKKELKRSNVVLPEFDNFCKSS